MMAWEEGLQHQFTRTPKSRKYMLQQPTTNNGIIQPLNIDSRIRWPHYLRHIFASC
jgi:hypothetical protein